MAEKEVFEDDTPYILKSDVRAPSSNESGDGERADFKTAKDGKYRQNTSFAMQYFMNDHTRHCRSEYSNMVYADGSKGRTVLVPQPSDDPRDPLNWSWLKKHVVLFTLLPGCFLTDGILTYGSTLFQGQAMYWHMSPNDVSQSISGGVFMQGPGGLLAVAFCQRYGRLPTLFWSQFLTLVTTLGAAGASGYPGFTACRTLQGFFAAAPQVIGLSMIHDMFFFHERARKINIWAFCFLLGPYFMPFISSWLNLALGWRDNFWVLAGICAFSLLTVVFLGDETLYDRNETEKAVATGFMSKIKLLLGVTGAKTTQGRPSILQTQKDQWTLIFKPYVLLPCFGFIMPLTMWVSITRLSLPPLHQLTMPRPSASSTRFPNSSCPRHRPNPLATASPPPPSPFSSSPP